MKKLSLHLSSNKHIAKLKDNTARLKNIILRPHIPHIAHIPVNHDLIDLVERRDAKERRRREIVPISFTIEQEFHAHYKKGMIALGTTLLLVGVWGTCMPLAGAVAVSGTFTVHSSTKKVQHDKGGIIKEIDVQEGSRVKAGDVLARLNDTDAKAQRTALAHQIDEITLRIVRLQAEQSGTNFKVPDKFLTSVQEHAPLAKTEIDFWKARQQQQLNNKRVAENKIAQLERQIKGYEAQSAANQRQSSINSNELSGLEELYKKRYTTKGRVTPLQQENARLEGARGQLESTIQEDKTKISEIQLTLQQSVDNFHSEVIRDLNDAQTQLSKLLEAYIHVTQILDHTDILAPVSGKVHELNIHTVGGVITPAETLMTIVPEDEALEVTARLSPDKIDQVKVGQPARMKLTAFIRTIPEIPGVVKYVSPDIIDNKSGGSYYEVKVSVNQHPLGLTLAPGMPVEVFLETDKRTPFSYLLKPLIEQAGYVAIER